MTKKLKIVMVNGTPITPITPKERKKLHKQMKKHLEMRRKKYPEVRGKVVDYINHWFEENILYISIRFKDKTDFSLRFSPDIVVEDVDLSDTKSGDFHLIRQYYSRRDR